MSPNSEMKRIITKKQMSVHEASLLPPQLLTLFQKACITIIAEMECEKLIVDSVEVKAIIMDDIRMAEKNLATLKGASSLNDLKLGGLNLN